MAMPWLDRIASHIVIDSIARIIDLITCHSRQTQRGRLKPFRWPTRSLTMLRARR
jgi:hypothetical protein